MKDLEKKNRKDLVTMLQDKRKALRDFRFSVSGSSVRNLKEGGALKKAIARILTKLNSKEVEQK